MYNFKELLELSGSDKKKYGVMHTPAEINQQPEVWGKTAWILRSLNGKLRDYIYKTGILVKKNSNIIITGAGTSEFVGNAASVVLQESLQLPVASVSTTDFIVHPQKYLLKNFNTLVVSVARSGDSPESTATYRKTKVLNPDTWQLVITCNKDGRLAEEARRDARSFLIVLPEETNDKGLAMTSSFSSMVLSLLSFAFLENMDRFEELVSLASSGARRILEKEADEIRKFIDADVTRVIYLGSGTLKGAAQEAHLKILEMTDGKIASSFNSYVGLRHGPQVFVDSSALVIAFLSGEDTVRRYEIDLLKEMQAKEQGRNYLFVCQKTDNEIGSLKGAILEILPGKREIFPDSFRVMTDIVVGQLAGLFKSLHLGLKPDVPSNSGTINRVVEGITIYGAGYDN